MIDMKNKTVTGDLFIVPNGLTSIARMAPSSQAQARENISRLRINGVEAGRYLGDADPLVQVWFTSPECDNWVDHQWHHEGTKLPFSLAGNRGRGLSHYIPLEFLLDVVEGSNITITMVEAEPTSFGHWTLKLTARQAAHRYRSFGKFEAILSKLHAAHVNRAA